MSTIKANTYLAASGSPTEEPSIPALDQRMAKAWVNFTGSNNNIRGSYNISSITDYGAGSYDINFTTSMSNTEYATLLMGEFGAPNLKYATNSPTVSKVQLLMGVDNGSGYSWTDPTTVSAVVFGN